MKHKHTLIPVGRRKIWLRQVCTGARRAFLTIKEFTMAIWIGIVSFHVLMIFAGYGWAMGRAGDVAAVRDTIRLGSTVSALKVGDAVPDLEIGNIINYKTKTARISDFKGKLLILDFWTTWCSSCISSLSKLDTLQQQFRNQLVVLPVAYQKAEIIKPILLKKAAGLPSVTQDSILGKLFPHNSVPHQVWIMDGVVHSITGAYSATTANIAAVLGKQNVDLISKVDRVDFDPRRPLMYNGNGGAIKKFQYQSLITGYNEGLGAHAVFSSSLVQFTNTSAENLFQHALGNRYPWVRYRNRILIDVHDSLKNKISLPIGLNGENLQRWFINNGFCYSLHLPGAGRPKLQEMMYADLKRFFSATMGLSVSVGKVRVKCLVLKRRRRFDLESEGGASVYKIEGGTIRIVNHPFQAFSSALTYQLAKRSLPPLLDETGYTGKIDLELGVQDNQPALQKELRKIGLDLQEEVREIEMLLFQGGEAG